MATLNIQGTPVFDKLWEAINTWKYRVIILKGGSRSSKTWSIIQALILLSFQKKRRISGWRLKRTWAKPTIHYDFEQYLKRVKLYYKEDHNQTELNFRLMQSTVEFNGLDDAQKLHGFTQDIAWINEAVEATKNDFDQLEMRTRELIILDCNPSEEESWVYELEKRDDVLVIHSTQKDNPFLEEPIRRKILGYEPTPFNIRQGTADEYKWKVYGLGQVSKKEGVIFPNYEIIPEYPEEARTLGYGLDFGFFPDPVAFARIGLLNGCLVIDELLYENGLNNIIVKGREELPSIQGRLEELGINRRDDIIADSAAKSSISELKAVGFNITPVQKYAGSVLDGLELMGNYQPFYVTERSANTIRELKNYTRKKNFATGTFLKEPIDAFNHIIDLVRYVVQTKINTKKSKGIRKISF